MQNPSPLLQSWESTRGSATRLHAAGLPCLGQMELRGLPAPPTSPQHSQRHLEQSRCSSQGAFTEVFYRAECSPPVLLWTNLTICSKGQGSSQFTPPIPLQKAVFKEGEFLTSCLKCDQTIKQTKQQMFMIPSMKQTVPSVWNKITQAHLSKPQNLCFRVKIHLQR